MKKKISVIMALVLMLSTIFSVNVFAKTNLPAISKSKPLTTYTYNSSGKVYAYAASNLKTKTGGYIACSTDECKIIEISGNAVKVTYPVSNGTKTAWFSREAFTKRDLANDAAKSSFPAQAKVTTYKWRGKTSTLGSVAKGDKCYLLRGNENSDWVQIIYPISNGYKMGWVTRSDYATISGKETTSNNESGIIANSNSDSNKYISKLDGMINGTLYDKVYKAGTKYTGPRYTEQCKGFARTVHNKLFGYDIGSTQSKPNNYKLNISTKKTELVGSVTAKSENGDFKKLFLQGRAGDFVQMRRSHGGSHSAILYSVNSDGVVFYECNIDGKNGIVKQSYTWAELNTKNEAMSLYTAKKY